jgi:hypothetical protein
MNHFGSGLAFSGSLLSSSLPAWFIRLTPPLSGLALLPDAVFVFALLPDVVDFILLLLPERDRGPAPGRSSMLI